MKSDRSGSEKYHDAFKPDPKPRKRVRDKELLAEFDKIPTAIPRKYPATITHHLTTNPRHDEYSNLMRLPDDLHARFHSGPDKMGAAREIRKHMTSLQCDYVIRQKGEAWLDKTYPPS